jgi:flagellar basal body-associated protein FliL
VSDQDFFFDEEEEAAPAPKRAERSAKSAKPAPTAQPAASQSVFSQDVSMSVAALMAVIALLIGVIIGIVLPVGGSGSATPAATSSGAVVPAPQLTEDQLNTGELPAGHPDISDMSAGTTETPAAGDAAPAQ